MGPVQFNVNKKFLDFPTTEGFRISKIKLYRFGGKQNDSFSGPYKYKVGKLPLITKQSSGKPSASLVDSPVEFIPEADIIQKGLTAEEVAFASTDRFLTAEEEQRLGKLINAGKLSTASETDQRKGKNARDLLVEKNNRLAHWVARRYRSAKLDYDDRVQEGVIGLIIAANNFDPDRGFRFTTYAIWWVKQRISQAVQLDRGVHLPIYIQEQISKLKQARAALALDVNVAPAERRQQLADRMEITLKQLGIIEKAEKLSGLSLDAPVGGSDGETSRHAFISDNRTESPSKAIEEIELSQRVHQLLDSLPERNREIVRRYFGIDTNEGETLEEIGTDLGITRERVRQLMAEQFEKLKDLSQVKALQKLIPLGKELNGIRKSTNRLSDKKSEQESRTREHLLQAISLACWPDVSPISPLQKLLIENQYGLASQPDDIVQPVQMPNGMTAGEVTQQMTQGLDILKVVSGNADLANYLLQRYDLTPYEMRIAIFNQRKQLSIEERAALDSFWGSGFRYSVSEMAKNGPKPLSVEAFQELLEISTDKCLKPIYKGHKSKPNIKLIPVIQREALLVYQQAKAEGHAIKLLPQYLKKLLKVSELQPDAEETIPPVYQDVWNRFKGASLGSKTVALLLTMGFRIVDISQALGYTPNSIYRFRMQNDLPSPVANRRTEFKHQIAAIESLARALPLNWKENPVPLEIERAEAVFPLLSPVRRLVFTAYCQYKNDHPYLNLTKLAQDFTSTYGVKIDSKSLSKYLVQSRQALGLSTDYSSELSPASQRNLHTRRQLRVIQGKYKILPDNWKKDANERETLAARSQFIQTNALSRVVFTIYCKHKKEGARVRICDLMEEVNLEAGLRINRLDTAQALQEARKALALKSVTGHRMAETIRRCAAYSQQYQALPLDNFIASFPLADTSVAQEAYAKLTPLTRLVFTYYLAKKRDTKTVLHSVLTRQINDEKDLRLQRRTTAYSLAVAKRAFGLPLRDEEEQPEQYRRAKATADSAAQIESTFSLIPSNWNPGNDIVGFDKDNQLAFSFLPPATRIAYTCYCRLYQTLERKPTVAEVHSAITEATGISMTLNAINISLKVARKALGIQTPLAAKMHAMLGVKGKFLDQYKEMPEVEELHISDPAKARAGFKACSDILRRRFTVYYQLKQKRPDITYAEAAAHLRLVYGDSASKDNMAKSLETVRRKMGVESPLEAIRRRNKNTE